ncbi:MAG: NAD(P)-binding domain-containing protein [Hyphomicrobiales bacterium]
MESLLTLLAFLSITAISVAFHLRKPRRGSAAAGAPACPRCRATLPVGAERCPRCGVPLQAYELVGAPVAAAMAAPAGDAKPHAIVRTDTCVGCGSCVAACPEPGAIRLEGKMAVVDLARCVGHGECATACPVGGIVVATGAAAQRIEAPRVNPHFETDVPGLYVVGELGGRGLIKNAINEGKIAVEHVARSLRSGGARGATPAGATPPAPPTPPPAPVSDDAPVDVIIVGSGPAGLSAGLESVRQGLSYRVLERGDLSDTIRRYPRHKILMAEPVRVPLYGDLWVSDASKEALLQVWRTIIERTGLRVTTGVTVERVARTNGLFDVVAGDRTFRGRRVVLAIGRRGTPRKLGVPGEELPKVFYDVVEMEAFANARILVVGGGDSAVEAAVGLARQEGTTVTLSYRGDSFTRVKDRNRTKLEAARDAGRVEILLASHVREIRAADAVVEVAGAPRAIPNDYVIVRAGGVPPFDFLRACGVSIVTKEIALPTGSEAAVA